MILQTINPAAATSTPLSRVTNPPRRLTLARILPLLALGLMVLISPAHAAPALTEATAVRAILGEASNQGADGMHAVANAIRNRGHLRGVYGLGNPVVARATPGLRAQAAAAWRASAARDITGGATHWGNARDVQTAAFYRRLTFTVRVGDHYFFREPQPKKHNAPI